MLHVLTHWIISQQHREQMQSSCFVRVDKGAGYLMVCDTVPRNYFFIFLSTLEFMGFFFE
jgi:hypothetical protein